jgi:hypothetical protein
MNDLSDDVKAELAKRVESQLIGFHVISLLKMMLLKPNEKKEEIEKTKLIKENNEDAKKAVAEIIDLVSKTVHTGKVPDKEAA